MHDSIYIVVPQRLFQFRRITQITFHQMRPKAGVAMTGRKIVIDDCLKPGVVERKRGVGSDVTGTTNNEDCVFLGHDHVLPIDRAWEVRAPKPTPFSRV